MKFVHALALLFSIALVCLTGFVCAEEPGAFVVPPDWITDFEKARVESNSTGKPILLISNGPSCGMCNVQAARVYPNADFKAALADFVPFYVDRDANEATATRFKALDTPCYVFFDKECNPIDWWIGYYDAPALIEIMKGHKAKWERAEALRRQTAAHPEDGNGWLEFGDLLTRGKFFPPDRSEEPKEALEIYNKAAAASPDAAAKIADRLAFLALILSDDFNAHGAGDEEAGIKRVKSLAAGFSAFEAKYPKSSFAPLAAYYHMLYALQFTDPEAGMKMIKDTAAKYRDTPYGPGLRSFAGFADAEVAGPGGG